MSQLLTRQTVTISPHNLHLLASVGDKVHADLMRMQPFLQEIVEVQTKILQTYAPILEMARRVVEITQPIVKAMAEMQSSIRFVQPTFEVEAPPNYIYRAEPRAVRFVEPVIDDISPRAIVNLPYEAKWDHLECRFENGHTLSVRYQGKKIGNYNHEVLGFARRNTKDLNPDIQWKLLQRLSIIYGSNNRVQPVIAELFKRPVKNVQACYKTKQNLAKKLMAAFGIADDPFYKYDDHKGYRLKFMLRPEPDLRGDGEVRSSGSPFFDGTTDLDEED